MAENENVLKWWEKSVEYKFIADAVSKSALDLMWPLDGREERVGDAVFSNDAKYLIVEFKDEFSSFASEYRKYRTKNDSVDGEQKFQEAKVWLGAQNHHLLVCGVAVSDKLELKVYKYFDCDASPPPAALDLSKALRDGIDIKSFIKYAENISLVKYGTPEGSGDVNEGDSGGGKSSKGPTSSRSKIIGIKGNSLAIYDYSDELILQLKKKYAPKSTSTLG